MKDFAELSCKKIVFRFDSTVIRVTIVEVITTNRMEQLYKIGAISRLTGINPVTIRMWETRYGAVEPARTDGKQRMYSENELARLSLMKQLTDGGDSIGVIARLPLEDLEERIRERTKPGEPTEKTKDPIKTVVLGHGVPLLGTVEMSSGVAPLRQVGRYNPDEALSKNVRADEPELLIFQTATLQPGTPSRVREAVNHSGAKAALVIYAFGPKRIVARMTNGIFLPLRAPVSAVEITLAANYLLNRQSSPDTDSESTGELKIQPRVFSETQLWQIVNQPNGIKCECPQHLSQILFSLNGFEAYMQECGIQNTADAEVHRYLHKVAAQSRTHLESAMKRLVEHESLQLDKK
ncbi:MAG: MerR family transcriptional regulator [Verrucomicrobiota bacterium]|nr:MerR family transcriptional regulator [Verrucomicrobiota bacterium]